MAKINFESPGQMIGAGIGILILGIILLGVGIGFIGAIVGIWWIIKGIYWWFKIQGSKRDHQNNINDVQQLVGEMDRAASVKNFGRAAQIAGQLSRNHTIKNEYKMHFARNAALYSVFNNDLTSAYEWNNDQRFNNSTDPDFNNINAMIYMGEGRVNDALDSLEKNRNKQDRGKFYDIANALINESVNNVIS